MPWIDFESRGAGLPADFQINGPEPVDGTGFESLDFTEVFASDPAAESLASINGPQTFDTQGWLPADESLPFSIQFENDEGSGRFINEVNVVSQLDADLDQYSFELGDIKVGGIDVNVPAGRALYQTEIDFTETNGFILRVRAGIDLFQEELPVATWNLQAIDPATGELLQDSTRGLLRPNNGLGEGAGFVTYSVRPSAKIETGDLIEASARVLFDTTAPEETRTISYMVDGLAPETALDISRVSEGESTFDVRWSVEDDLGASGFKHVTVYVAENGEDFKIWQRQLPEATGSLIYEGTTGNTYEFLALATDIAGNQEKPRFGQNVVDDGSSVNLGGLPTVPSTTAPNFGQPPEPMEVPSSNPIFAQAEQGIPNVDSASRPSEFEQIIAPMIGQAFATGIPGSHADIGPMAIVEMPSDGEVGERFESLGIAGHFIISGGSNRGELYRFDVDGGQAELPFARLDHPIFNMVFDSQGKLWATTGGGPLLQLDPVNGEIIEKHGDGLTIALAVEPETDRIYVSSNGGVEIFDPVTGEFDRFSRDLDLRVGSLAFDRFGDLWATTWPDRQQVVRFTDRSRAELMLRFDAPIDSLAFGQPGSDLEDLLFVTANAGEVADTGAAASGSELTMVDVATLRRAEIANGGTRGDAIITTGNNRVILSQSNQVDVISPAVAPIVVVTNPADEAAVALPLPFVSVTFDQDMLVGNANDPGSVLNPDNYSLVGDTVGELSIRSVKYSARARTALIVADGMLADNYTLTVSDVRSAFGLSMAGNYTSRFLGISDLSALVDVGFGRARSDRSTNTISYEVSIRNRSDLPLILPVLLTLDPAAGYKGLPTTNDGKTDDGKWLLDLSESLPDDGRLEPGESVAGRTLSIVSPDNRRVQFAAGIIGQTTPNQAPEFIGNPLLEVAVGQEYVYNAMASDPDAQPVVFFLLSGPEGMAMDSQTGQVTWTPSDNDSDLTPVTLAVFDPRGAAGLQRYTIRLAGGNRAPEFIGLPDEIQLREGEPLELGIVADDPDNDEVSVWADNIPAGSKLRFGHANAEMGARFFHFGYLRVQPIRQ